MAYLTSPTLKALAESLMNPAYAPQFQQAMPESIGAGGGGVPPAYWGMGPMPSTPQPRNPPAAFAQQGASPYMPSVTAGVLGEPEPRHFATPDNPNLNYLQREPSLSIAQRFGGQLNTQDMTQDYGPMGPPSQPIYSVSFPNQPNYLRGGATGTGPYEVDMPTGQIQFWKDRGDPDWLIASRLGINNMDPNWKGKI